MSPIASSLRLLKFWPWLELVLILSVISLALQTCGPAILRWWQLPSPGKLGIDRVGEEYGGICLSMTYVVALPNAYHQHTTWPLVVCLHGSGERGHNPKSLFELTEMFAAYSREEAPSIVVMPQCLPQCNWQAEDIRQFVTSVRQRYPIDEQRVYLVGYSMGGYGTWAASAAHPELYAAIVPITGGGQSEFASALVEVPTWAFHGNKDDLVPVEESTSLVDAIKSEGGNPRLTLYPEADHDILGRVVNTPELWQWLFQHRLDNRPQPTTEPAGAE